MLRIHSLASTLAVGATLVGLVPSDAAAAPRQDHPGDIVETAVAAGSFTTLAAALEAAGLVETLQGDGPFTVFAPTDDAFAALPDGTVESLLEPENRDALVAILTYHVVAGRVTSDQVVQLDEATTVNGAPVQIAVEDGTVRINQATVTAVDVAASNGVIHVIDQVLLPPEMMSTDRSDRQRDRTDRMELRRNREAADILTLAIERGVPLFNDGQIDGTLGVYEVAARSVLAGDFALPRRAARALENGLDQGRRTHSARDRAWVYRAALDRALDELEGRMALRDRH